MFTFTQQELQKTSHIHRRILPSVEGEFGDYHMTDEDLGKDVFIINHGDRIAQAVVSTVTAKNIINLSKVSNISTNTERADGGFGSTGKN